MHQIHLGRIDDREVARLTDQVRALSADLRREAGADAGVAGDAVPEGVEAVLLARVAAGRPIVGPSTLGVGPEEYLLGLGDLTGEVRRLALSALARGDLDSAEARLALLDELFHTLMRFDASRAVVPLKPKQDAARGIVERTRGDVVLARYLATASPRGRR